MLYTFSPVGGFKDSQKESWRDPEHLARQKWEMNLCSTWSGLNPGGTHVYSSSAQPLSSSLCECLWWCCIRASCNAKPAGAACTGLLNGSWWGAPPASVGNAMAIAIGGLGPSPSPGGPPASVEVRWCSSRGHLQLLHTFLQARFMCL